MRSALLAAAGLFGLAAVPGIPSTTLEQGAARPVVVNVTCTGQGVNFSLTPWSVGLSAANPVDWRINASANTDEITIEPKVGEDWPFEETPPFRATKAAPKRGGSTAITSSGFRPSAAALAASSSAHARAIRRFSLRDISARPFPSAT